MDTNRAASDGLVYASLFDSLTAGFARTVIGVHIEDQRSVMGIGPVVAPPQGGLLPDDAIRYSLREFLTATIAGDPKCINVLFAPAQRTIFIGDIGQQLRSMREQLLTRDAVFAFTKAAKHTASTASLMAGVQQRGIPGSAELLGEFLEPDYVRSIALRLAFQAQGLATTGTLKHGIIASQASTVADMVDGVIDFRQFKDLLDESMLEAHKNAQAHLPSTVDYEAINSWVIGVQLEHWTQKAS